MEGLLIKANGNKMLCNVQGVATVGFFWEKRFRFWIKADRIQILDRIPADLAVMSIFPTKQNHWKKIRGYSVPD